MNDVTDKMVEAAIGEYPGGGIRTRDAHAMVAAALAAAPTSVWVECHDPRTIAANRINGNDVPGAHHVRSQCPGPDYLLLLGPTVETA